MSRSSLDEHPRPDTAPTRIAYPGRELELFETADNWKTYWSSRVRALVRGRVADVGAGLGGSAQRLAGSAEQSWLFLEPDPVMAQRLDRLLAAGELPARSRVWPGVMADLPDAESFDTILYCDVLEHIEDDHREVAEALARLAPGGHLIVLVPAGPCLTSAFDRHVGHARRYTAEGLARLVPDLPRRLLLHLDSVGTLASLANRWVLRQSLPAPRQLRIWDRWMVPLSRRIDDWLGYRVGRTLLAVWQRPPAEGPAAGPLSDAAPPPSPGPPG